MPILSNYYFRPLSYSIVIVIYIIYLIYFVFYNKVYPVIITIREYIPLHLLRYCHLE